ncbi:MAG: alpha-galactosidase [Anaerolineaceae bacterium]
MHTLQNASLALTLREELGTFSLHPLDNRFPFIEDARLGINYQRMGKPFQALHERWDLQSIQEESTTTLEHGEMNMLRLRTSADPNGLSFTLTYAIPLEHPLILWKIQAENLGSHPVEMDRILLLSSDAKNGGGLVFPRAQKAQNKGFFSNGWQSWSPSRWYNGEERMNLSRLGAFQHPMIYNPGTPLPRSRGVFSSDMFAVLGDTLARVGCLVGFLSQNNHFGSIYADLPGDKLKMWANGDRTRLDPGGAMETDWAVFTPILLDHRAPLESYLDAVGRETHARIPAAAPVGWCSWYHFYTSLTAEDVTHNLAVLQNLQEELPLELVQIDDGFESQVGDWLSFKPGFPEGVAPLADAIRRDGLIPGLWLAPFIIHPTSRLFHDHSDWLLRRPNGRPANAGFVWNRLDAALDLTVPQALDYVRHVISTAVHKWGFSYLKLDFLYAAALEGIYQDRTQTRAQVLRMGMKSIREAAGEETMILGCGAPLGSMLGIVDAMRIGPDVSGDWTPQFLGIHAPFTKEPAMPSARNSLHNILTRANLQRKWWFNDPDCLLLRPETHLSLAEVRSLATAIAMTGGSLLLSDDLPRLPEDRLRLAEALLPVMTADMRVLDWCSSGAPSRLRMDCLNAGGEWHVLAAFNWSDQAQDLRFTLQDYHLENGDYVYREFWEGNNGQADALTPLHFQNIPPHGVILLAVRRQLPGMPVYLGSDLHFSQGEEVADWKVTASCLEFTLRLPRTARGNVFLILPAAPLSIQANGQPIPNVSVGDFFISIPVTMEGFCHLRVEWN